MLGSIYQIEGKFETRFILFHASFILDPSIHRYIHYARSLNNGLLNAFYLIDIYHLRVSCVLSYIIRTYGSCDLWRGGWVYVLQIGVAGTCLVLTRLREDT